MKAPALWQPGGNDPCPCGSAKRAKVCCLEQDGWRKHPTACEPPPPATGRSEPKCLARDLSDCDGGPSGEHILSTAVLKSFKGIVASGFSWLARGESKVVAARSLNAHVLCRRHNSALSGLDQDAGRFFTTLRRFDPGLRKAVPDPTDEFVLFAGEDLERWCLKVLVGLLAAGWATVGGQPVRAAETKRPLLDMLFGVAPWPQDAGLSLGVPPDGTYWARDAIGAALLSDPAGNVLGVKVEVAGFWLVLSLVKVDWIASSAFGGGVFRPRRLVFRSGEVCKVAELSWADSRYQHVVALERVGEHDGDPPAGR
jgi:hypothetical protein